jgi:hypothetical protein
MRAIQPAFSPVDGWVYPDGVSAHADVGVVDREVVLRVDFDLLDDEGCSWISMRFHRQSTARPPSPGDTVYLLDRKGQGCVGEVQKVDGWYVCVRPDWNSWTGGELPTSRRTRDARRLP